MKHLIKYCWKTWAEWYQDKIITTTTKIISDNIVCMAKPVKRYWKSIWKDAGYTGHKESRSHMLKRKRSATKSSLKKQNTNYIYLLSSMRISKVFYVNKTCVIHRHQNSSSPNISIMYPVGAASLWNAVMGNTLNHTK